MTISKATVKTALFNVIRENLDVKTIPANLQKAFEESYKSIILGTSATLLSKTSISPDSCGNMGLLFEDIQLEIEYAVNYQPKFDDEDEYVRDETGTFLKVKTLIVKVNFSYSHVDGGTNGASRTFKVAL